MNKLALAGALSILVVGVTACKPEVTAAQRAEQTNVRAQMDVKARATASIPVPQNSNFQARRNLAEFMSRVDERGKIWYVYERAPLTGKILGFYQSSSYPQSVCTFMTPPEELKPYGYNNGVNNDSGHAVTTAMALDGVYYKGGDCPDFFFDYTTGAMVVLDSDAVTIAVDQPLDIDVPNFSFAVESEE